MLNFVKDQVIQTGVEYAIQSGIDSCSSLMTDSVVKDAAVHGATLVPDLVRGILAGKPKTELIQQATDAGMPPHVADVLLDRLSQDCRERIEFPLFRFAAAAAAALWIGPVLALGWVMGYSALHGDTGQIGSSTGSLVFFSVVGLATFAGLSGPKVLFPAWYAIHRKLNRNKWAMSRRRVSTQLATWLAPIGGHVWYLTNETSSSPRCQPKQLAATLLLAPFGTTAILSWFAACDFRQMTDDQFDLWVRGKPGPQSKPRWGWLSKTHERSPAVSTFLLQGITIAGGLVAAVGAIACINAAHQFGVMPHSFFVRAATALGILVSGIALMFCGALAIRHALWQRDACLT